MDDAEVAGLTADGQRVVVRVAGRPVEVRLDAIHRAEREHGRPALAPDPAEPLTPKIIQRRIRAGESAEQVALSGGWPVEVVARYEGPVLAEREHHASSARRALVDGLPLEALVANHFGQDVTELEWDSWQVAAGQWEVRAAGQDRSIVLRWEPAGRAIKAVDETTRRILRQSASEDALTAVLRPLASRSGPAAMDQPARSNRRTRAEVPLWDDISRQVTGSSHDE